MAQSPLDTRTYRCHVAISRDDEGRFSAVALNLPGAGSCGDTSEEAVANAREAVLGIIASYREENLEIPWTDSASCHPKSGVEHRWIFLNA